MKHYKEPRCLFPEGIRDRVSLSAAERDAWMQAGLQGCSQAASGNSQGTPGFEEKRAEFSQSTNIILKLPEGHRTYGQ